MSEKNATTTLPPLAPWLLADHEQQGYLVGFIGNRRAKPPLNAHAATAWYQGHRRGVAEARRGGR